MTKIQVVTKYIRQLMPIHWYQTVDYSIEKQGHVFFWTSKLKKSAIVFLSDETLDSLFKPLFLEPELSQQGTETIIFLTEAVKAQASIS